MNIISTANNNIFTHKGLVKFVSSELTQTNEIVSQYELYYRKRNCVLGLLIIYLQVIQLILLISNG